MDTSNIPPHKDFWDGVRETVREGLHEIRNVGEELARQGRLRMDIFQTERRLKNAYGDLGQTAYRYVTENRPLTADDPAVAELLSRIHYYSAELERLHHEQVRNPESPN